MKHIVVPVEIIVRCDDDSIQPRVVGNMVHAAIENWLEGLSGTTLSEDEVPTIRICGAYTITDEATDACEDCPTCEAADESEEEEEAEDEIVPDQFCPECGTPWLKSWTTACRRCGYGYEGEQG